MPQSIVVDVSVTVTVTGDWWEPGLTATLKPALGTVQIGAADGEALGLGLADPLGEALGEALALGDGLEPVVCALAGSVSRFCTDDAVKVTFWFPPKNAPISGVRRRK